MIVLVDTIKTPRQKEMQPWEFLVFICRMTYEHYQNTPYKDELMHIKLEKMLPSWLAPVFQSVVFEFGEEFEYDKKMAKKREKARRRAMGLSSEEDDGDDETDSEEDE